MRQWRRRIKRLSRAHRPNIGLAPPADPRAKPGDTNRAFQQIKLPIWTNIGAHSEIWPDRRNASEPGPDRARKQIDRKNTIRVRTFGQGDQPVLVIDGQGLKRAVFDQALEISVATERLGGCAWLDNSNGRVE